VSATLAVVRRMLLSDCCARQGFLASPLDHNICAAANDFHRSAHAFAGGHFERSRSATLGDMVELAQAAVFEPCEFLKVSDLDLRRGDVEDGFEAGQTVDVFLPEHEAGLGRRFILTDQNAHLPKLKGASNGIIHTVILVDWIS